MEIIFAVFGGIFALAGLFFAGSALFGIIRSVISRSWVPVQGTILSSEISVDLPENSSPTGASYNPDIQYEYEANGKRFTGNNLNFSRFRTNSPGTAARTLRHYPPGGSVTVYHSPWRPERSVLEPGKIGVHISGLILGTALAVFGTFFGLGGWYGFDVMMEKVGSRVGINEAFVWRYFPPFVILIGIGIIIMGVVAGRRSRRARNWPTTEGTIIASGIIRQQSSGSSGSNTVTVGGHVYKPEVGYEYEVNGERYISNRIELLDIATNDKSRAQSIQGEYNQGDRVRVYYDPENPEHALLKPRGGGGSGLLLVVGAGFVIIASIIMGFGSLLSR